MNFDDRKRKSWREESGVSEIVGNILILMITVVLFTSIMAFVNQIPIPEQQTKATFDAKITFLADGEKADLTITHTGGDSMEVQKTLILVDIGDITKPYNLTADSNFAGVAKWKINMPWKQLLDGTSYMSRIQVTVVDMIKHAVVWTSQVTGGTGGSPPNIVQRWTDSDKATATPDAVLEWDDFWFYATIDDPDGDLNTSAIWIDTHQLETDLPLGTSTVRKDWTLEGSNVYRWAFLNIQDRKLNASDLDGNLIFIHAWDEAGHESVSTFKMVVTRLPIQPVPDYPDNPAQPVGESGLPAWLTWFSEDHGFGIYAEFLNRTVNPPIPLGIADTNNPTTIFVKNTSVPYYPKVFVRFASLSMTNINTQNRFTVKDVRTGLTIAPVYTGNSTASKPFYPHPTAGGSASIYECQFSTSNLVTGLWSLGLEFKNSPASGKPQLMFNASQTIMFELEGSPMGFIPEIKVTNKPDYSGTWGERNTPFEVSSVDKFKVYVLVSVKDATYPPAPGVAEVRIVDMNGAAEVYGIPPAGAMMSPIKKLDGYTYNFSIDLRLNNGQQWKSGTNSYTLVISKLNDTNEGMYSLSLQIFITGAGSRADFFVGTTGMASGNGNFNTRLYSYYVQNNNLFTTRVLWQSESTPGASTDFTVTALAAGDVDGDGAKDLLMGQAASNELYLF